MNPTDLPAGARVDAAGSSPAAPESWHVVQSKPRQESVAREHLSRQGFRCVLPLVKVECIRRGRRIWRDEPLFARYLFIAPGDASPRWGAVRSTRGVSRMVEFGGTPARLPGHWIEDFLACEHTPRPLFSHGERVVICQGPFAGLEGVYELSDGEERAVVLLELLGRECRAKFAPEALRAA